MIFVVIPLGLSIAHGADDDPELLELAGAVVDKVKPYRAHILAEPAICAAIVEELAAGFELERLLDDGATS